MLNLNPNDNQGIRDILAALLLKRGDIPALKELLAAYRDDSAALWCYTEVLLAFRDGGGSDPNALKLVKEAWRSWSKLPVKLKDIVTPALNESALRQRQDIAEAEVKMPKGLEADGIKFHTVDSGSFRSTLRKSGYYAAWKAKIGEAGWAALEKYSGRLIG